jgi:NADH-quinone oxidoreductase subunit H
MPAEFIRILVGLVAVALSVGLIGLVMVWVERKVAGHVQRRPGPYEVGPYGLFQPLADALKLVGKQLFMPDNADPILYWLAPVLAFLPVLLLFLPLPVGDGLVALDINLGLLLILAFSGLAVLSLLLGGWSQNNKYGLLGAARAVSQSVAYEIPLLLSVLAVCFVSGSLNLTTVVKTQGTYPWNWNVMTQPLAFLIYIVSALGETNRAPFDLPEAESELTAGFHTEYSGMGFGLFFLAEYANMVVVSSVATALFLGGWQGPVLPGPVWFVLKVSFIMLLLVFFRWTYPRVRFDQLLNINWKWLMPLAVANLLLTSFFVKLAQYTVVK